MPDPETVCQAQKEEVLEMPLKAGQEVPTGTLSCKPLIIDTTSQDRHIFLFPQFLCLWDGDSGRWKKLLQALSLALT